MTPQAIVKYFDAPRPSMQAYQEGEDMGKYVRAFELTCKLALVPAEWWAGYLAGLLSEKGHNAPLSPDLDLVDDYQALKVCVLDKYSLTTVHYLAWFREGTKAQTTT